MHFWRLGDLHGRARFLKDFHLTHYSLATRCRPRRTLLMSCSLKLSARRPQSSTEGYALARPCFSACSQCPVGPLWRCAARALTALPLSQYAITRIRNFYMRKARPRQPTATAAAAFSGFSVSLSRAAPDNHSRPALLQVKFTQQVWHEKLSKLLDEFPRVDGAHSRTSRGTKFGAAGARPHEAVEVARRAVVSFEGCAGQRSRA